MIELDGALCGNRKDRGLLILSLHPTRRPPGAVNNSAASGTFRPGFLSRTARRARISPAEPPFARLLSGRRPVEDLTRERLLPRTGAAAVKPGACPNFQGQKAPVGVSR